MQCGRNTPLIPISYLRQKHFPACQPWSALGTMVSMHQPADKPTTMLSGFQAQAEISFWALLASARLWVDLGLDGC